MSRLYALTEARQAEVNLGFEDSAAVSKYTLNSPEQYPSLRRRVLSQDPKAHVQLAQQDGNFVVRIRTTLSRALLESWLEDLGMW